MEKMFKKIMGKNKKKEKKQQAPVEQPDAVMFDGFKVIEHEEASPDEFEEVDATDLMRDKLKVMSEQEVV